ncbi:NifB/NifX family molybdenum-iron cluster-binding protein [Bacteroidota bacterium]
MKKKFAVPTLHGKLCAHFGHCEKFAIVNVANDKIIKEEFVFPPMHQPGVYPKFLADMGVNVIIAGGIGQRAIQLFSENNIEVFMGIDEESPSMLVNQYVKKQLMSGNNLCDH